MSGERPQHPPVTRRPRHAAPHRAGPRPDLPVPLGGGCAAAAAVGWLTANAGRPATAIDSGHSRSATSRAVTTPVAVAVAVAGSDGPSDRRRSDYRLTAVRWSVEAVNVTSHHLVVRRWVCIRQRSMAKRLSIDGVSRGRRRRAPPLGNRRCVGAYAGDDRKAIID
ncbi:hypothetical protein KIN20_007557 [Parelaphostrongylus tenuis]|uniref:Uncharacterized protein n=1 Tax=Parelaphostrongylus tenuis TaxID=148309 RepID=A0AAD5M8A9_PARTN|nr:hypothetical protein KIN20_007557 [Parelaphostrongylus tenuis]